MYPELKYVPENPPANTNSTTATIERRQSKNPIIENSIAGKIMPNELHTFRVVRVESLFDSIIKSEKNPANMVDMNMNKYSAVVI